MWDRNFCVLVGTVAFFVVCFLGSCSYQSHTCKLEAIKAGMKAEEVSKACRSQ